MIIKSRIVMVKYRNIQMDNKQPMPQFKPIASHIHAFFPPHKQSPLDPPQNNHPHSLFTLDIPGIDYYFKRNSLLVYYAVNTMQATCPAHRKIPYLII